ncbi:MAG: DEAD/DEAH box helicase [Candidatus Eremiobacteraeota bacterium]|nr:DEAD/DEAH box helicase [Candidatus Eremiobacteraeota bacterium]
MQFISSLDTYADDLAAQAVWARLRDLVNGQDGYCFYKHPLFASITYQAPDLTLLARSYAPLVIVLVRASADEIQQVEQQTWTIEGQPVDSPLLQLEDFVVGLRERFSKDRSLRGFPTPIGAMVAPSIRSTVLRELVAEVVAGLTFAPVLIGEGADMTSALSRHDIDETTWLRAKSVFQGANILTKAPGGEVAFATDRMGVAIRNLEREIALLDEEQLKVAIQIAPGPQRIRGLAGTGKTVVLAMKAALLHLRYPDKLVLFTFHTQSLYNQARNLITKFYRQVRDVDPDWEHLHIRHSWGSRARSGVYSDICRRQGQAPLTFREAASRDPGSPLRACCNHVLNSTIDSTYDYILVDEAQDFPAEYFQVLARLLTYEKRVYFAYDELQSLTSVEIPRPEELFGNDANGRPYIEFNLSEDYPGEIEKDLVLRRSYRCPLETLVLAHGIGLGIHGPHGIVQMVSDRASWESFGYEVRGELEPGQNVEIHRPAENSPNRVLALYNGAEPIVQVQSFGDREAELAWVAASIERDIRTNAVKPEDIVVVCLDSRRARAFLPRIQRTLERAGISSIIPGLFDQSSEFAEPGHVTLSTVYRAKGNEAPVVYIAAFDALYSYTDEIENRNRAFTSMSRSKGWLRITGSGILMTEAAQELARVQQDVPSLRFTFPDLRDLRIRRLDASETSRRLKEVKRATRAVDALLSLERNALTELDPKMIAHLKRMLAEVDVEPE